MSGDSVSLQRCTRCGAAFHCGRNDASPCWCTGLPPLDPRRYDAGGGCMCEACLRRAVDRPPVPPAP